MMNTNEIFCFAGHEWIALTDSAAPVAADTIIDCLLRRELKQPHTYICAPGRASAWMWQRKGDYEILGYRVVQPDQANLPLPEVEEITAPELATQRVFPHLHTADPFASRLGASTWLPD